MKKGYTKNTEIEDLKERVEKLEKNRGAWKLLYVIPSIIKWIIDYFKQSH